MNKDQVAEVLQEIGTLLELQGRNPFKTRAYLNAARTIGRLEEPLEAVIAAGRLGALPRIGAALWDRITELAATGRLAYYEELKAAVPAGLRALLEIPGLGPRKIKALRDALGIESVAQLEQACREGRVAGLAGFGAKTQANLLAGIARRQSYASYFRLGPALAAAEPLQAALRAHPDVIRCDTAGSLRRCREVIGDIDLLASSARPARVIADFIRQPGVARVLARGETKASVLLESGMQADLRVVRDAEFPAALLYFTGSKEHNVALRQRALERGLRLNEYGLFRSRAETRDPRRRLPCAAEAEIFARLGLRYIPPELREDRGEIPAAEQGPLPRLVEWTDLQGSLHNHSNWSDGQQRLEEIARLGRELGLAYWAVTDHSKSSVQAHGLEARRVRQQMREIAALNEQLAREGADFRLLTGIEVDILKDGALDLPDDLLAELDVVVASAHQSLGQPEAEMTRRLIRAAQNPCVHILGHLTGRLLLEREPSAVDARAVIDACAETGTWIELNAHPQRLDLDWRHWPYAKSRGVKFAINCDAHRAEHAGFLRLGAGIARKGWLTREDVVNTLPLDALRQELGRKRARAGL